MFDRREHRGTGLCWKADGDQPRAVVFDLVEQAPPGVLYLFALDSDWFGAAVGADYAFNMIGGAGQRHVDQGLFTFGRRDPGDGSDL